MPSAVANFQLNVLIAIDTSQVGNVLPLSLVEVRECLWMERTNDVFR